MESHAQSHESSLHFSQTRLRKTEQPTTNPTSVRLADYFPDTPIFRYTHARYHDRMKVIDDIVGKTVAKLERRRAAGRHVCLLLRRSRWRAAAQAKVRLRIGAARSLGRPCARELPASGRYANRARALTALSVSSISGRRFCSWLASIFPNRSMEKPSWARRLDDRGECSRRGVWVCRSV